MTRFTYEQAYASMVAIPQSRQVQGSILIKFGGPTPIEVDATCRRRPLSQEEKQRRQPNTLCIYCGGLGSIAIIGFCLKISSLPFISSPCYE